MTLQLPLTTAEPVLVALVFVRIVGVAMLAPLFAHSSVPVRVRAALALTVAVLVAPSAAAEARLPDVLGVAVLTELVVGVAIGFVSSLVIAPVGLMSELASIQGGLGAAAVVDPGTNISSVALTSLLRSFAIVVFLAIGGHHEVIRALWLSFERIPLGTLPELASFASLASLGAYVFEAGLRLAAPLTLILFVSNLVIGALGRAIPQLNLIALQLPAQVGLTLLVLALSAGVFFDSLAHGLRDGLVTGFVAVLGSG